MILQQSMGTESITCDKIMRYERKKKKKQWYSVFDSVDEIPSNTCGAKRF
jgi:hypothetical protein